MSQRLILPIDDCQLNAGYKSAAYLKQWGYGHYGGDFISVSKYRVLRGMGNGRVVACGMDGATPAQKMGNSTVIVFDDVELNDGRVLDLACRMFHQEKIAVKVGQEVTPATILGEYGNTGASSTGPHLHIEFDTDTQYPQYAYGIKSSGQVIKKGSKDTTIDPCKVFWLAPSQSLTAPAEWIAEGWMTREQLQLPTLHPDKPDADLAAELSRERELRQEAERELEGLRSRVKVLISELQGEIGMSGK
ncbi:MAG: M23 family metallopeptidase [Angelakisella sp.]